jgi:hypothetical protein
LFKKIFPPKRFRQRSPEIAGASNPEADYRHEYGGASMKEKLRGRNAGGAFKFFIAIAV